MGQVLILWQNYQGRPKDGKAPQGQEPQVRKFHLEANIIFEAEDIFDAWAKIAGHFYWQTSNDKMIIAKEIDIIGPRNESNLTVTDLEDKATYG